MNTDKSPELEPFGLLSFFNNFDSITSINCCADFSILLLLF